MNVGKVKFFGMVPVVNASGAEVVPSFKTSLIRYVVLGSIPATRTLVLFPGTTGCGDVLCHDGSGPAGVNSTVIDVPDDGHVPELWHWLYLLDRPPSRLLGLDGHPTSGIPAPPGPGMRRMFASGRVDTLDRLRIGEPARRTTRVVGETEKQGRSGPLRFVTVRHVISQCTRVAIVEEQVIVYRTPGEALEPEPGQGLPTRRPMLTLDVDQRLLFRFSALTYNAHRIHYDP